MKSLKRTACPSIVLKKEKPCGIRAVELEMKKCCHLYDNHREEAVRNCCLDTYDGSSIDALTSIELEAGF